MTLPLDLPRGSKHKLSELRVMVKEDPAFQNMSEEATKILLDDAQAWRDQKRVGARPSNKSVAQDYRHAVKSINTDVFVFLFFIYNYSPLSFYLLNYLRLKPLRLVQEQHPLHSSHAPT